ncbi:tubulinyl-Tyr carboxypeptidase 1-like isoform X2 [Lineus longissimus]|uniref:tubulinyl-Tyr carboxypeptidase 1-like isoform X2 n=1 Tax=Lineus longissimus TaxID=88925 RepID=UPI002B4EC1A6
MMEDAVREDNGVLFWINRSGFPLEDMPWERMWEHVSKIHPDGHNIVDKIRKTGNLKSVPVPQAPLNFPPNASVPDRVNSVQKYMKALQYNHTGTQFFEIRKNRPISGLMDCARDMIKDSLPIKCLEAVILGIFLTNGIPGLERFMISFKSCFSGNYHRHVVLGLYYTGKFGAIGMSRRDDLMYKPLKFNSLTSLILDFESSYNRYWHEVKKVKIGLPIPHDPHSYEQVSWKYLTLNIPKLNKSELHKELEKHSKEVRSQVKGTGGSNYSPPKLVMPSSPKKEASFVPSRRDSPMERRRSKSEVKSTSTIKVKPAKDREGTKSTDPVEYQIRI